MGQADPSNVDTQINFHKEQQITPSFILGGWHVDDGYIEGMMLTPRKSTPVFEWGGAGPFKSDIPHIPGLSMPSKKGPRPLSFVALLLSVSGVLDTWALRIAPKNWKCDYPPMKGPPKHATLVGRKIRQIPYGGGLL